MFYTMCQSQYVVGGLDELVPTCPDSTLHWMLGADIVVVIPGWELDH